MATKCLTAAGVKAGTLRAYTLIEDIETGDDLASDFAKRTDRVRLAPR